jgi:hypothetical protein
LHLPGKVRHRHERIKRKVRVIDSTERDCTYLSLVVGHLLRNGLGALQVDGELDELAVARNDLLELLLGKELFRVLLEVQLDLRATAERRAARVLGDREVGVGRRLPDVLLRNEVHRNEVVKKRSC